ncbi:hypothetical protein TcasGA2_TC001489 [Tribolium castaneum]|uniref:Uncharacterized protein n=1 Tax=Tribolium castaneum TaxID=7070 RepID=D7ELM6_TRICA|nr:hypothetical protein TcasGA2_TC001489 [Tribolium castaneum]
MATIHCYGDAPAEVRIEKSGILTLQPKCRCYTESTVLIANTNSLANAINFMPDINLNEDDCCIRKIEIIKSEEMEPINLKNLNLEELQNAHDKLAQYDNIIQDSLNKPFISKRIHWFSLLCGILIIISLALFFYCCCCNCFNFFKLPIIERFLSKNNTKCNIFEICINSKNSISNNKLYPTIASQQDFQDFRIVPSNQSPKKTSKPQ